VNLVREFGKYPLHLPAEFDETIPAPTTPAHHA